MIKTESLNIIGLKELRENVSMYADQVKKGKSLIVVKRSRPLFKIVSVDEDEALWEEVFDFNTIKKGGVKISDVLKAIRRVA